MSDRLLKESDVLRIAFQLPLVVNSAFADAVKALPSADRPQGEWIWDNDAVDWNLGAWICSNCHARNDNIPHSERAIPLRWSGSKFCPNCGARMKGADDE